MPKKTVKLLILSIVSQLLFPFFVPDFAQAQVNSSEKQQQWRKMSETEKKQEINALISHKMSITALNQLAIEGFIAFDCQKSFYVNDYFGGMQTLMRIKCSEPKGASSAVGYDEVRVIFNRFEGNIEAFQIQRIGAESDQSTFSLPD